MTALEVAQSYGLPLKQRGGRHWACCPLHGEKTASLCFFPDGRWYCFGCHQHGDAADLYAALYGVPLAEALRLAKGDRPFPGKTRQQRAAELRHKVQGWQAAHWAEACRQKHQAQRKIARLEVLYPPEVLAELESFWNALAQRAAAEDALNLLASATPAQLLRMIAEANAA